MKQLISNIPRLIDISEVASQSGTLLYAEVGKHIPFTVQRVYYICGVPEGSERGAHAHKELDQVIIAVSGSFVVDVTDGKNNWTYALEKPNKGLYLPAGVWRTLRNFSKDAVCLVLASDKYISGDYIHDYNEFLAWESK